MVAATLLDVSDRTRQSALHDDFRLAKRQWCCCHARWRRKPQFSCWTSRPPILDFGNQAVMREIRALAAPAVGVLFTTHDPNQSGARPTAPIFFSRRTHRRGGRPTRENPDPSPLEALYGAPVG